MRKLVCWMLLSSFIFLIACHRSDPAPDVPLTLIGEWTEVSHWKDGDKELACPVQCTKIEVTDSTWTEHFTVTSADWFTQTSPYGITGNTITLLGNHKYSMPEGFAGTSMYTYTLTSNGMVLRMKIYNDMFNIRFKK